MSALPIEFPALRAANGPTGYVGTNGHPIEAPAAHTQAGGANAAMLRARRWVCYRLVRRDNGRIDKVPFYESGRARGETDTADDVEQLASYERACNAMKARRFDGIGFALGRDGDGFWQGIDLDGLDENGHRGTAGDLPGYVEHSPSGNGVHAIGYGQRFDSLGSDTSGTEAYSEKRFFTYTGKVIRDGELCDLAPFIEQRLKPLRKSRATPKLKSLPVTPVASLDDRKVEDLRDALQHLDPNSYPKWVAGLSALKSAGEQGKQLAREWSARSPKHIDLEFDAKWLKVECRRTDYRAIFAEAQRNGWINPNAAPDYPPLDAITRATLDRLFAERTNRQATARTNGAFAPRQIEPSEWRSSRMHPGVIVADYLYADVGILIAPGGAGKTTLVLYEAICIAIGRSLYGKVVARPGRVVIVSAEDSREQLIARLAKIADSFTPALTAEQISRIQQNVIIAYVGGEPFRLCEVRGDVVVNSAHVEQLIASVRGFKPSVVVIDPVVSFGVGESRVNDAEQGLISAFRTLRDELECCIRGVHHTGKQNARDGTIDQYSGRGGSAMADGARMVAILKRLDASEWLAATGETLADGADGLLLALPKLSYGPPQPHIYLERTAFAYRHVARVIEDPAAKHVAVEQRIIDFLRDEEAANIVHSKSSLEASKTIGLSRNDIRAALASLDAAGRVIAESVAGRGQGKRLRVVDIAPVVPASNDPNPSSGVLFE